MVKVDADKQVKNSVKEFTVPTLTYCVHTCIWDLQQNCSGITYQRENQSCTISNSTELVPSPSFVETYLSRKKMNGEYIS